MAFGERQAVAAAAALGLSEDAYWEAQARERGTTAEQCRKEFYRVW